MEEVSYSAGGRIKTIAGACKVKIRDCLIDLFLHAAVLLLIVKRPVFKNNILGFRNIDHKHLRRHLAFIIGSKTNSVAFGTGNAVAEGLTVRVVDICHYLTAAAVRFAAAPVVRFALDTVEQTADGVAVLPRYGILFLPEVQYPLLS